MTFLDLAPITPAMEFRFFIQNNLGLIIGGVATLVAVAAVLIVKAVGKKK